jgi:hypothetical protein
MKDLQTVLDALEIAEDITYVEITEAIAIVKQMMQAEPVGYVFSGHGLDYIGCVISGTPNNDYVPVYASPVAPQAEPAWQPIESAPKDGTVILLLRGKEVIAGTFHAELGKFPWLILEEYGDGTNGLQEGVHGPTHWMALPSPPKGTV